MTKKIRDPTRAALKCAKQNFDRFKSSQKRCPTLEEFRQILKNSGFAVKEEGRR